MTWAARQPQWTAMAIKRTVHAAPPIPIAYQSPYPKMIPIWALYAPIRPMSMVKTRPRPVSPH